MTDDGRTPPPESEYDEMLQGVAHAPDVVPAQDPGATEAAPERLAHFRVVRRLGSGGMGIVYVARDEKLQRDVALKVMPAAMAQDAERRQRFLREARSAAAVTHANIATVYEVGEHDGRIFIAMELVSGQSLGERLESGLMEVEESVSIARGILRGLARAHERGIVHRDLKPDNVMLAADGDVKILDFGLAKLFVDDGEGGPTSLGRRDTEAHLTRDGHVVGTPSYMSPEQARGGLVDARTDVFAFGVVLYEMLTGQRPFRGTSTIDVLMAVCAEEPPPPSKVNPKVGPRLEALVARCMRKSLVDRFASAREVLTALEAPDGPPEAPEAPVSPAPSGSDEPRPSRARWSGGRPAVAMALAAVAIAGGVIAFRSVATRARGVSRVATPSAVPVASTSLDHPPKTANADAAAAYLSGLRQLHNASFVEGTASLRRAVELDPSLAAGYLRLALLSVRNLDGGLTPARRYYALATQLRDGLDARDDALLSALEPALSDPVDQDAFAARLRDLVTRFPSDAELHVELGLAQVTRSGQEEARREYERALELDPTFAAALWAVATTYRHGPGGTPYLDQCLALAPASTACLTQRALAHATNGQCAAFEADTRHLALLQPGTVRPHQMLAVALAAEKAPMDGVREALQQTEALAQGDAQRALSLSDTMLLAELSGDLGAAEAAARARMEIADSAASDYEHLFSTLDLIDILDESSQPLRALDVADAYERRAAAWTQFDLRWKAQFAYLRLHAGRADHAAVETALADALAHPTRGLEPAATWINLYVAHCETPDEAAEALAALPEGGVDGMRASGVQVFMIARVFTLAGRLAEALSWAREAAITCNVMSGAGTRGVDTIWYIKAQETLGEVLEKSGDSAGACAAYGVVLDRWRNVRPRSVTLDRARERARALACSAK